MRFTWLFAKKARALIEGTCNLARIYTKIQYKIKQGRQQRKGEGGGEIAL